MRTVYIATAFTYILVVVAFTRILLAIALATAPHSSYMQMGLRSSCLQSRVHCCTTEAQTKGAPLAVLQL
jgi:hypothetical protein